MIVRVGADIDGFEKAMGSVSQRLRAIDNQAARAFSGFDKIGSRLQDVGGTLTASLTLPLAAIGGAALKTAGDFELSLNKIKAFGDITGDKLEALRKQALKLGADTQFSAQQAADAMVVFASAGMSAEKVYAAMPGTLALAAAGQLAVAEAATLTKDILGQFQLRAEESGRVADVLAQASADASASLSEMATTLTYAGPVAKGAGQSLEETTAAIIALDAAGIRGEKAGTGLRGVIASLIAPSSDAAKNMAALGISVSDSEGRIRPLSDIMEQFRQKLSTVGSEAERQRLIFEIFGREAGNAAQVLIQTGGPALDAIEQKLINSTGAADRMAKTINSGLNFALDQFKGSAETAGIALGTALIPSATRLLGVLTDVLNTAVLPAFESFGKLPQPIQDGAVAMAAMAAVVGPLAIGLGLALQAIGSVGAAITTAAGIFTSFGATAIPAVIAAMSTFATVTVPAAASAVFAFATTTLPAAIAQIGLLSRALLVEAAASVTTFATVSIPGAIAAVSTFATTAIPAAIAAVIEFATVSLPAAISSLLTFASTSVPAAITSLSTLSTTAIPSAIASLQSMAAAALPAVISALSAMGVAALAAGAAFAGWKLGQWAYEQIPGVKALGDSVGDLILKIPGVTYVVEKLSGATAASARAQADMEAATLKLEAALKRKGITVDRTGLSTEQYAAKLKEAAKQAGLAGTAHDTTRAKVEAAKKQIQATDEQTKIYNQALAEMGRKVSDAGAQHLTAQGKIRQFQDGIPAAIVLEYEAKIKSLTKEIARTTIEHQLAAAAGKDFAGQLDNNIQRAMQLSEQLGKSSAQQMPAYVAGLGSIGKATTGLTEDLKVAVQATKGQFDEVTAAATTSATKTKSVFGTLGTDISTVFTNTAQSIAKSFFDGNTSVGEKFKKMAMDMGEAVIAKFIEPATKAIGTFISDVIGDLLSGKGLGGVLGHLKEIGSSIASIFGAGASVAAGAANAVGGVAGAAGSAAGAMGDLGSAAGSAGTAAGSAGSAASGALGAVSAVTGIVTGIVSAVSGVISNFQLAKQETTLNEIEKSTRYVKIWFGEQSQNALWCLQKLTERSGYVVADLDSLGSYASEQLAWLQRIGAATEGALNMAMQTAQVAPAGGGMTVTLSNITFNSRDDVDYLLDELGRRMREAGQTI